MMRMDFLARQNPWWTDINAIEHDPYIREFERAEVKWIPSFIREIDTDSYGIYIFYGPRQVGKTTGFKLLIRDLIGNKKVNPRKILYLNCEEIVPSIPQRLAEVITDYVSWSGNFGKERSFIFIDEATYIKDWQTGIKIVYERGDLKNSVVMATGSHMKGLKRGSERLPGRRGKGKDIPVLPLSFREYVRIFYPDISLDYVLRPGKWKEIFEIVRELSLFYDRINTLFFSYILTGGFPRAIREYKKEGFIPPEIHRIYRDGIMNDMIRMGRREESIRELIQWLFIRRENPFEWTDLSRETYVGTHPTVREYIEDGESAFLWNIVYRIRDLSKPLRAPRAPKKVYFTDPFIHQSMYGWVMGYEDVFRAWEVFLREPVNLSYVVENILASHLNRNFNTMFYFRNGWEIDFVVFGNGKRMLIELKYQKKITYEDMKIVEKYGEGVVVTQNTLKSFERILLIPLPLFLCVLEK